MKHRHVRCQNVKLRLLVIPAQAGIQWRNLDSRLRGNDESQRTIVDDALEFMSRIIGGPLSQPELMRRLLSILLGLPLLCLPWMLCPAGSALAADDRANNDQPALGFLESVGTQLDGQRVTLTGRVLVTAQDGGVLLEERNGCIHRLTPSDILSRTADTRTFSGLSAEELAEDLQKQMGDTFQTLTTDHYVVCYHSSEQFATFCGNLLEHVRNEFVEFLTEKHALTFAPPHNHLPVVIVADQQELIRVAGRQHPEQQFDDVPGFYSIRSNQILIVSAPLNEDIRSTAGVRRQLAKTPKHVATIVHEAVHQLAFNSGLQIRFADNPLWLSEGLALWFEPVELNAKLLWKGPGQVNSRHRSQYLLPRNNRNQPGASGKGESAKSEPRPQSLALNDLVKSDELFLDPDTVAQAYATSWALTSYLIRKERTAFETYLKRMAERKPLVVVTPEERLEEFRAVFGKSADEFRAVLDLYVARLRVPR
jgi:hypothetical protein